jgi:soluble lytic murein transglycosylase-like protein
MSVGRFVVVVASLVSLPMPLGSAETAHEGHSEPLAAPMGSAGRPTPLGRRLDEITARARAIQTEANELEVLLSPQVTTIRRVLTRQGASPELAALIAGSLVREGGRTGLAPHLLLAVMLVENPWINPDTTSHVGAIGLMQVMPFHAGSWGCPEGDLTIPEVNICYGAEILAHALGRSGGDLDRALLRYNGCVVGANTHDCHDYPSWVRRARASVERVREMPVEETSVPAA